MGLKYRQKCLRLAVSLLIFTASVLGWPWLAAEQVSFLVYFLFSGMGKRIGRAKPRRFEDQDKKTLIGKKKVTWKESKRRKFFITSHWKSFCPRCYGWSGNHCGMEYPSGEFGSAVPAIFPPSFVHTPILLMKRTWMGKR